MSPSPMWLGNDWGNKVVSLLPFESERCGGPTDIFDNVYPLSTGAHT